MTPTTADLVAAAIAENMAHPAMIGADPLTECLTEQCWHRRQPMPAEACTEIGAEPSERDRGAAARFWVRYVLVVAVACIAGAVAWMR